MTTTNGAYEAERSAYFKGFAANVRRLRTAVDTRLTQEQLADLTRLHRTEIGKIEQASVEPRLTTLVILAEALGVKIDDLVDGLPVPVKVQTLAAHALQRLERELGLGSPRVAPRPIKDRGAERELFFWTARQNP